MGGSSEQRLATVDGSQPVQTTQQASAKPGGPAARSNIFSSQQSQPIALPAHILANNQQRLASNGEKVANSGEEKAALIKEGPIKIELPVFKPKNECNVIKIIQKEWDKEVDRLNQKKFGKRQINAMGKVNCAVRAR